MGFTSPVSLLNTSNLKVASSRLCSDIRAIPELRKVQLDSDSSNKHLDLTWISLRSYSTVHSYTVLRVLEILVAEGDNLLVLFFFPCPLCGCFCLSAYKPMYEASSGGTGSNQRKVSEW